MEKYPHGNWGQTEGLALDRPALSRKRTNQKITTRYKIGRHNLVYTFHMAGLVHIGRNVDRMGSSSTTTVWIEMAGRS